MKHYGDKQRLRDAKHKNRLRRLKNWKNGTTAASAEHSARQGKADQAQGKAADRRRNGTNDGISDEGGTEQ